VFFLVNDFKYLFRSPSPSVLNSVGLQCKEKIIQVNDPYNLNKIYHVTASGGGGSDVCQDVGGCGNPGYQEENILVYIPQPDKEVKKATKAKKKKSSKKPKKTKKSKKNKK